MPMWRGRRPRWTSCANMQKVCGKSSSTCRHQRHHLESSPKLPSSKEPPGLIRTDGKRPDGATLIPWSRGRYLAWDATAIHTSASSYIHLTASMTGGAAEQAAERKRAKYENLPAHDFTPLAIE